MERGNEPIRQIKTVYQRSHHRTDIHVPVRQQKHQNKPPDPGIERTARLLVGEPRGKLVREAKERDPQEDGSE